MPRIFRTLILIVIAFVAGLLYQRGIHTDTCLDRGGRMDDGVCFGDGGS